MLFFFKEKPIYIISFVSEEYAQIIKTTPIRPAKEMLPEWWKKVPSSSFSWDKMQPLNTVKSCPGIGHLIQRGAILPLWCDLALKFKMPNYEWQYSDSISKLELHNGEAQMPGYYTDHSAFKLLSPWFIMSPVPLLYTSPDYYFTEAQPYFTPSGIVTPIHNYCTLNIFMFIKKTEEEKRYFFKAGTPMLHIIPLSEKKVNYKIEVLSDHEHKKIRGNNSYSNFFSSFGLRNKHMENLNKK